MSQKVCAVVFYKVKAGLAAVQKYLNPGFSFFE